MEKWLVNGIPGDSISLTDRGLNYADGLFETIAIRDAQPRLIEKHLARLLQGCQRLQIPQPDTQLLRREITLLVDGDHYGTVKIMITRGSSQRGYRFPDAPVPSRIIGFSSGVPGGRAMPDGVRLRLCKTMISGTPMLAGIKTLARIEQLMARAEWEDPEIAEGLMSDAHGQLVCGTMSNVFIVRQGNVLTPDLSTCGVKGVMRAEVIAQATSSGISVREQGLLPDDLFNADEIFITNALIGIWPVTRFEDHEFMIGPVTRQLMSGLSNMGIEECSK